MSDFGELILHGVDAINKLPLQAAQTQEMYSRIPGNYVHAAYEQAQIPKTQIETEMNRLKLQAGQKQFDLLKQDEDQGGQSDDQIISGMTGAQAAASQAPFTAAHEAAVAPQIAPQMRSSYVHQPLPRAADQGALPPPAQPSYPTSTPQGQSYQVAGPFMPPPQQQPTQQPTQQQPTLGVPQGQRPASMMLAQTTAQPVSSVALPPPPAQAPAPVPASAALPRVALPPPTPLAGSAALQRAASPPAQGQAVAPNQVSSHGADTPIGPVPKRIYSGLYGAIANGQDMTQAWAGVLKLRGDRLAQLGGAATDNTSWNAALIQAWREGWLRAGDVTLMRDHYGIRDQYISRLTDPATQANNAAMMATHGMGMGPQGIGPAPGAIAAIGAAESARTGAQGQSTEWTVDGQPFRIPNVHTEDFLENMRRQGKIPQIAPQSSNAPPGGGNIASGWDRNNPVNMMDRNHQPIQYASMEEGVAAAATNLASYPAKYGANTVEKAVKTWVGPGGGNVDPYIKAVSTALGVAPNQPINLSDPDVQAKFIMAAQPHETGGRGHVLDPAVVQRGVQMAAHGTQVAGGSPGVVQPATATPADAIAAGMVDRGAKPGTLAPGPVPGGGGATVAQVAPIQTPYGVPTGIPALTPQQQAALEVEKQRQVALNNAAAEEQKASATALGAESTQIVTAGYNAQAKLQRLFDLEHAANDVTTGPTAEARAAGMARAVEALQVLHIKPPDWMAKGATGAAVIEKEGGALAADLTRMLGSGEAAAVFNSIRGFNPSLSMTKGGFSAVVASLRQGIQRDLDLFNFRDAWLADPSHNHSIDGMLSQFNAQNPVEKYASRVIPFPMPKKEGDQIKGVWYATPPASAARTQRHLDVVTWDGQQWQPVQ